MRTFIDSHNRTISIAVTVGSISRVKTCLGIDLSKYDQKLEGGQPLVAALAGLDVMLLVNVLYWTCKPDLDRLDIDPEAFAEAMSGDAIQRAQDAFMGEWSDFFRGLQRTDAIKVIEKGRKLIEKTITAATTKAEMMLSEQAQDDLVAKAFSKSATDSAGSSESIPLPSHSGNSVG